MPSLMVKFIHNGEEVELDIFSCSDQDLLDAGVSDPLLARLPYADYQGFLDALEEESFYTRFVTVVAGGTKPLLAVVYTDLRAACLTPTQVPGTPQVEAGNFTGVVRSANIIDSQMTLTTEEKAEINTVSMTYLFRPIFE